MKRLYLILSGLIFICTPLGVYATGKDSSAYISDWNATEMETCKNSSNVGAATIGTLKNNCTGSTKDESCALSTGSNNEYRRGLIMMVAHTITANGAYFCPTVVAANKKKKKDSYTEYFNTTQGGGCLWLCKPGFSGDGCTQSGTVSNCDTSTITRETYDAHTMSVKTSVENKIPMFYMDRYEKCGKNLRQEHDMILAISDWLPSGHGVKAQPFVVMGGYADWKKGPAVPNVWKTGTATILCKTGYTANSGSTDCVPIDEGLCGATADAISVGGTSQVVNNMCNGYPINSYDAATMTMSWSETCINESGTSGGYLYKCNQTGYALIRNGTTMSCSECTSDARGGIAPDGLCVTCAVGTIFDTTASDTNYCAPTYSLSNSDMQYGPNKGPSTELKQQCWIKENRDDYIACVTNSAVVNSVDTDTINRFQPITISTITPAEPVVVNNGGSNNNTVVSNPVVGGGGSGGGGTYIPQPPTSYKNGLRNEMSNATSMAIM